jgi:hypothetical protein
VSIEPFSFWVEFSPVFGGFKNKNVKKVGFFGSLFKMLDSAKEFNGNCQISILGCGR